MTLTIRSAAFADGAEMPVAYTADGEDQSPPLAWSGAPPGTRSYALIVDDPDAPDPRAPKRTWVHWVVVDIPATVSSLPADASARRLPAGSREGRNDAGRTHYHGPAPPIGRHRYFFKLYALDDSLGTLTEPTKAELLEAMKGHVLAQAELIGTYERGTR